MLNQVGMTRIEEGQTISLSSKRVEPKIEFLVPIKANLLFIVFENRIAKFFETDEMTCVHKLHFELSYKVKVDKCDHPKPFEKCKIISMTRNASDEESLCLTDEEDRDDTGKSKNSKPVMNFKSRNPSIRTK